jgi:DDE superfamily endonuclease
MGSARGCSDPGWANQKVLYDAKRHAHTAQGVAVATVHGDLLWLEGGWPGSCHEQELLTLAGLDRALDRVEVAGLLDRGFRGMARSREHWHAPVGDRRTRDTLSDAQRAYNRLQAGLRALVEQSIGHLANAWALRRWRGLLYRVRDVFRGSGRAHLPGPLAAADPHMTRPDLTAREPPTHQ